MTLVAGFTSTKNYAVDELEEVIGVPLTRRSIVEQTVPSSRAYVNVGSEAPVSISIP